VDYSMIYRLELLRILTAYNTRAILEKPMQYVEVTGIGLPDADTVVSRAPFQHGDTFLYQVTRPRVFSVSIALKHLWGPASDKAKWGSRQNLLSTVNSALGELTFEITMTNGDIYELRHVTVDAGFDAGIATSGSPIFQRVAVRFVAHDPFWYGLKYENTYNPTSHNTSAIPAWIYSVPTETVGSWFSYPEIDLTGPLYNPILFVYRMDEDPFGMSTDSFISITQSIAAGEHVYIRTRPGEREVVDDNGDNVSLSSDTVLSTFQLTPSPIRLLSSESSIAGWYQNLMGIQVGTGVGAAARATFRYWDRYNAI